jgi:hypothetical protein
MTSLIKLILALVIAFSLFEFFASATKNSKDLNKAALGDGTTVVRGEIDGHLVHCEHNIDIQICLSNYKKFEKKENTALWLGNSQLHAINQMSENDEPASALLSRKLLSDSTYLLTMSQANANLQEHYVILNYISKLIPLDILILPVVFDDLREIGLRQGVKELFDSTYIYASEDQYLSQLLELDKNNESNLSKQNIDNNDLAGLDGSIQQVVEDYLNQILGNYYESWSLRGKIRGNLELAIYRFRNFIFRVSASTKRKMIPGRYDANMNALDNILSLSAEKNIQVLLYIPPLRDDYPRPYVPEEYSDFKETLISVSSKYSVNVFDFESVVPNELWGLKESTGVSNDTELDFMHFQAEGHKKLSNAIYRNLQQIANLEN